MRTKIGMCFALLVISKPTITITTTVGSELANRCIQDRQSYAAGPSLYETSFAKGGPRDIQDAIHRGGPEKHTFDNSSHWACLMNRTEFIENRFIVTMPCFLKTKVDYGQSSVVSRWAGTWNGIGSLYKNVRSLSSDQEHRQ